MNVQTTCASCHRVVQFDAAQPLCPACGARLSPTSVQPHSAASVQAVPDWELKVRQWGIGLIVIGLIGLALPLFGLQLRRLRNLGEAQWMVLCTVTFVGCCAFAYSARRNLLVSGGVSAVTLLVMTGLAFASFGPSLSDENKVAQSSPIPASNDPNTRQALPSPPSTPATDDPAAQPGNSTGGPTPADSSSDPVKLTGQTVELLERTRDVLASVVDLPSARRAASDMRTISEQRDKVVEQLQAVRSNISQEQNQEIGRLYGAKLGQLAGEVSTQLQRISTIPGATEALQGVSEAEQNDPSSASSEAIASSTPPQPAPSALPSFTKPDRPQSNLIPPPATSPPPDFEPLPEPSVSLPRLDSSSERIRTATLPGEVRGTAFTDTAPPGGVLVGLRVIQGESWGGSVDAIQPIYQTESSYTLGQLHGNTESANAKRLQVVAKPGWAVGQLQIRQGLVVNAVRVVFHPVRGKSLDSEQSEFSPWLGGEGGSEMPVGSPGTFVVGLTGTHERLLLRLGVHQLQSELDPPEVPLPQLIYAENRVEPSPYLGGNAGTEFTDQAPEGGILVGLILSQGPNWGGALQAVQPIYQIQDRYELGQRHGATGGNEVRVLAKPGYAIGGVRIRSGLVLNAMQLVFMRFAGKQLDPNDRYESDWVGSDGGGPAEFIAKGQAIAGVYGKYQVDLHGIGLGVIPQLRARAAVATKDQPRTWRSNDGKSSVEATLIEVVDGHAVLRRADNRTVKVPLSRLSDEDQSFVKSREAGR